MPPVRSCLNPHKERLEARKLFSFCLVNTETGQFAARLPVRIIKKSIRRLGNGYYLLIRQAFDYFFRKSNCTIDFIYRSLSTCQAGRTSLANVGSPHSSQKRAFRSFSWPDLHLFLPSLSFE